MTDLDPRTPNDRVLAWAVSVLAAVATAYAACFAVMDTDI